MLSNLRNRSYKLLRLTEKYAKVDMVYLIKGGFWLTLGNFIAAASGFLLSLCFANLLPKEVYGQYKYILSVASIFSISTLQGMDNAIVQSVAKGMDRTLITGIKERIKWGVFGSLTAFGFAIFYFLNKNTEFALSFLVISMFLPFMDSFSLYSSYLNGKKEFKKITTTNAVGQIAAVATMIVTIFLTRHLYFIIAAYFIPATFARLFFTKKIINGLNKNTASDQETLKYGKHLSLLSILGTVTKTIDQVIIYHLVNSVALATYTIAVAPVKELQNIIRNIDPLSLPKFAERNFSEIKKTLWTKIFRMIPLIILIVGFYILTIPYFYKFFYPQYVGSIKYSQFFSLNILFYPFILINTALTAHMKQKELYISNTASSIFYLIALCTLTYKFGIMGVIATYIFNNAFTVLVNVFLFRKAKTN